MLARQLQVGALKFHTVNLVDQVIVNDGKKIANNSEKSEITKIH